MQQTALDRWLRKKFIYINRVYCNTLPQSVPFGIRVEEAPEESGGRFLYKLSTRSDRALEHLTQLLKDENITYTSRVEDRNTPLNRLFNHPNKSFTFRASWVLIGLAGTVLTLSGVPQKIWAKLMEEEGGEALVEQAEEEKEKARIYHAQDQLLELDRQNLK